MKPTLDSAAPLNPRARKSSQLPLPGIGGGKSCARLVSSAAAAAPVLLRYQVFRLEHDIAKQGQHARAFPDERASKEAR